MTRVADHPIEPLLLQRHSPRAMSGEPVTDTELNQLCEAARWSPSAGNLQPWRLVLTVRDTPAFAAVFEALAPGNQLWCQRAGALLAVCSVTQDASGRPLPSHAFDAGAAWLALALQGSQLGLVVHGMAGFDGDKVRAALAIPAEVALHIVVAVGRPGPIDLLPEALQAREPPNGRQPITAWVSRDRFGAD